MPDCKRIEISTTYADRYLIRSLPGANYNSEAQIWRCPVSWAACIVLRGLFGEGLQVGDRLTAWSIAEYRDRIYPALVLRDRLTIDDTDQQFLPLQEKLDKIEALGTMRLFGYQRADVAFLVSRRRAILANAMGVGKTASAIRTMQVLREMGEDPFPVLVVCPNTVKETWAGELAKFAPEITVSVIGGSAGKRRKALESGADVLVINWESIRIHSRLAGYGALSVPDREKAPKELNFVGFRTVIADEAHHARDPHAKQTRAIWALMKEAEFRFLMTGTPVVSHMGDLWALLHAIEPEGFPAKTKYLDRWARVELGFFGGSEIIGLKPETADEFRKATDPLIRRIPKEAALPQLPPKYDTVYRYTEMSPSQAKLYRQMELNMVAWLHDAEERSEMISAPNAIAKLTRLIQFASATAEGYEVIEKDPDTGEDQAVTKVRLKMPSAKVDDLIELLGEMGDEPLVVAAVSSQLINLAAARLERAKITYGLITGAQNTEERQRAVAAFQDGQIRVILMTIDTGGEGITLTRASTILFMQRHWGKTNNDQCEDRLHRIGQRYPVQVIDQITPGTCEYRKLDVLAAKQYRIEEIVRDRATLAKILGA